MERSGNFRVVSAAGMRSSAREVLREQFPWSPHLGANGIHHFSHKPALERNYVPDRERTGFCSQDITLGKKIKAPNGKIVKPDRDARGIGRWPAADGADEEIALLRCGQDYSRPGLFPVLLCKRYRGKDNISPVITSHMLEYSGAGRDKAIPRLAPFFHKRSCGHTREKRITPGP